MGGKKVGTVNIVSLLEPFWYKETWSVRPNKYFEMSNTEIMFISERH